MNKLKKVLLPVFVLSAAALCSAGFAACHEHDWKEGDVITPATCTNGGVVDYFCDCGEHKSVDVDALGHTWAADFTTDKAPTCTEDGSKSKHCGNCDEKSEVTPLPAAHKWAADFTTDKAPTCTEDGSKSKHCTVDECDGKTEVTPLPAAHKWAEDFTTDKAPTCTEDGSKSKHCTVDGCDGKTEVTPLPAAHTWATDFTTDKAPTCTEDGSKSKHCTVDGCDGKTEVTPLPAAHTWATDFTTDKEPTCTEDGSKSKHCENCDEKTEVTPLPAAHTWAEEFTTDKAPTCTEDGSKSKHCTVDGCDAKSEVTPVSATGHKYENVFTVDKEPTCTEDGSKSKHCENCDSTTEVTAMPAGDGTHKWANDFTVDKEPTCTEDGSKSKHCGNCDEKAEVTSLPANGHSFADDFTVDKEPTCTDDGSKSKHCENCDEKTEVTSLPANGHLWNDGVVTTEPACTEDGVKTFTCSTCNADKTEAVPAAHKWADDFTVDKEPTCTEEGSKSKHCENCDEKTEVTALPANGHSFADDFTVDKEPTCTEEGSKSKHCENCDEKAEVTALPANGHSFADDFTVDKEPTCTEDGSKSKHCGNCDEKTEVTTLPAGHDATEHSAKTSTCAEKGHEAYWQCENCGKYFADSDCTEEMDQPVYLELAAHTYDMVLSMRFQKDATCTEDGYKTYYVCKVCEGKCTDSSMQTLITDEMWETNFVLKATHKGVSKRAVKAPTCTTVGYSTEHYYCSKCRSYALDKEFTQPLTAAQAKALEIEKLGHDFEEDWTVDTEPTCSKAGSKSKHCTRCANGKDEVTSIDTVPHTWGSEYVLDLAPTCAAAGYKTIHCDVCDASNEESKVELPVTPDLHAWSSRLFTVTPATCVGTGVQAKFCLVCQLQGESQTTAVNPDAHNFSKAWTVDREASCTATGLKTHHCLNDGCTAVAELTEETPALGHNYVWSFVGLDGTAACANGCGAEEKHYTSPVSLDGKTVNNVIEANAAQGHYDILSGANFVNATQQSYYLDMTAQKSGVYSFTFDMSATAQTLLNSLKVNDNNAVTKATINGEKVSKIPRVNLSSIEIELKKDENLSIGIRTNTNVGKDPTYIMTASLKEETGDSANTLVYGKNTVKITTVGDMTGVDSYTFTPTSTKKYSITVPEGMSVVMNNSDLISSGTYGHFTGTNGRTIKFAFAADVVGEYEVVIGEEYPSVLELDARETTLVLKGKTATALRVGENLAPGKYTLTFSGGFLTSRMTGYGKLWFRLNGSSVFEDVTAEGNGAVYLEGKTDAYEKNGYEIDTTANQWTVTLELAAGDVLYFAPDATLSNSATINTLYVALSKAV